MKKVLAGVLLIGTAAGAQAADLAVKAPYYKAPVLETVYDWTGFYVGVNAGVGLGRNRTHHDIPGVYSDTLYLSPEGAVGGGQIGYNWQTNSFLGPLVYGIEADIQGADMTDNRTNVIPGFQYNQRLDWFGTVRGRIGLATGPTLSYVTAGYAYGNVKTNITEFGTSAFSASQGRSGWTYGTGVEAALGGNWTGKIEYLYLDLGDHTDNFGIQSIQTKLHENIFRVGLNYRIGGNSTYTPVVASNWAGFYLGGNIGSGTGRDRSSLSAGGATDLFNLAPDGINGGVEAGYNWQAGNWVYGVETDIQYSSQEDNRTCVVTCSAFASASYNAKLPWFGTVRGRIGYSVGPSLFYVTGGYAYGEVKTKIASSSFATGTNNFSFSNTQDGWTAGAGIETPFTLLGLFGPNWTTKTEYLYVDLGSTTNDALVAGFPATTSTHVREHIFRTGLNYHFNSPVIAKY